MAPRTPAIENIVRARVRELRGARGMTQEQLCESAGISVDAVNRIENGTRVPTLATLSAIAKALQVDVADLVQDGPPPPPSLSPPLNRLVAGLSKQSDAVQEAAEQIVRVLLSVARR